MITYSLNDTGNDSLYEYLYRCIKRDILTQQLKAGEKLPSKRAFARNQGVSVITVENAYAQLIAEGYIYSEPKRGFFVAELDHSTLGALQYYAGDTAEISKESGYQNNSSSSAVQFGRKTAAEFVPGIESGTNQADELIDFVSNQADFSLFPFSVWSKLIRELLNEKQKELVEIPPGEGIYKLRTAIAEYLRAFRDINVQPEQIIVGAGTEYLYGLLIQLLGFDKIYAVEDPGYKKIAQIYKQHKVACTHIPMDGSGISIKALNSSDADILHLSPSHHFPTGKVTPINRRYELLKWAAESDQRYIIEDDYDIEFRMTGKPVPSMLSIDHSEKIIYMNTFSKTLASTVRISYMVLPIHLVERFKKKLSFYSCTVSNFEQYLLANFMHEGYFEKHINRMRRHYHQKRDTLISRIRESGLAGYTAIHEEDSGLHFILEVKTEMEDEAFCAELLKKGLRMSPLSGYYTDPKLAPPHCFVINYTAIPEEKMDKAIQILLDMIK